MSRPMTLLLALIALLLPAAPSQAGLHAGDAAPDFRGTDLDGVSHRLSDFRGRVVMLFVLGNT